MTWQYIMEATPADAQVVWLRQYSWSPPILATWSATAATFTLADGRVCPWYSMVSWRAQ